jgi:hypothetical protein
MRAKTLDGEDENEGDKSDDDADEGDGRRGREEGNEGVMLSDDEWLQWR